MRTPEDALKCPGCGYAPPIGNCKTMVFIQVPRIECRKCQQVRTIKLPDLVSGKNHTKSFVRLVIDLRKMMMIQDVAHDLGVRTTMIRGIDKQYLKDHFAKPKLKHVKLISIDDIRIRRCTTEIRSSRRSFMRTLNQRVAKSRRHPSCHLTCRLT